MASVRGVGRCKWRSARDADGQKWLFLDDKQASGTKRAGEARLRGAQGKRAWRAEVWRQGRGRRGRARRHEKVSGCSWRCLVVLSGSGRGLGYGVAGVCVRGEQLNDYLGSGEGSQCTSRAGLRRAVTGQATIASQKARTAARATATNQYDGMANYEPSRKLEGLRLHWARLRFGGPIAKLRLQRHRHARVVPTGGGGARGRGFLGHMFRNKQRTGCFLDN